MRVSYDRESRPNAFSICLGKTPNQRTIRKRLLLGSIEKSQARYAPRLKLYFHIGTWFADSTKPVSSRTTTSPISEKITKHDSRQPSVGSDRRKSPASDLTG